MYALQCSRKVIRDVPRSWSVLPYQERSPRFDSCRGDLKKCAAFAIRMPEACEYPHSIRLALLYWKTHSQQIKHAWEKTHKNRLFLVLK